MNALTSSVLWKIFIFCFIFLILLISHGMAIEPDKYEDPGDDSSAEAHLIIVSIDSEPQKHNFHEKNDEDWVMFRAVSGEGYTIKTDNLGSNCRPVLELRDADGVARLKINRDQLSWDCEKSGYYFVKIRNLDPNIFGEGTEYELSIFIPAGGLRGIIYGVVTDAASGNRIGCAYVKVSGISRQTVRSHHGYYWGDEKHHPALHGMYETNSLELSSDSEGYTLIAECQGYKTYSGKAEIVKAVEGTCHDIIMEPDGGRIGSCQDGIQNIYEDVNIDCKTDMSDAISILQSLAGMRPIAGVKMKHAIRILKVIAGK